MAPTLLMAPKLNCFLLYSLLTYLHSHEKPFSTGQTRRMIKAFWLSDLCSFTMASLEACFPLWLSTCLPNRDPWEKGIHRTGKLLGGAWGSPWDFCLLALTLLAPAHHLLTQPSFCRLALAYNAVSCRYSFVSAL